MSFASPLLRSLSRPHGFEPLRVEGTLPEDLRGTLYRAGPAIYERFGKEVKHPFEANGAITAVRFEGGRVLGASRIVESAGYREEGAAGRFLYNSSASWLDRMRAASRPLAESPLRVDGGRPPAGDGSREPRHPRSNRLRRHPRHLLGPPAPRRFPEDHLQLRAALRPQDVDRPLRSSGRGAGEEARDHRSAVAEHGPSPPTVTSSSCSVP